MTGVRRALCDCCESGSCVNAVGDCPATVAFEVTTPSFALNSAFTSCTDPATCTITETAFTFPTTTTGGTISCANGAGSGAATCLLQYRCLNCAATTCASCEVMNYDVTTIPAVLKICTGSGCGSHNKEWDLGTQSGFNMGSGTRLETYDPCGGAGPGWDDPCSITYSPAVQNWIWVPHVVSLDTTSSSEYWEYSIRFECCITSGSGAYIGDVSASCGDLVDSCGRASGMQQVMDSSMLYNTGLFVVRKEIDSCFAATWNGATQTASGINVISITPPTSGSAIVSMPIGSRCISATGDMSCTWDECDFLTGTGFLPSSTDSFATSHGGTISWSIT
jgi:hypothetical protein